MTISTWGKKTTLLLLLIGVHAIFGIACRRVLIYSLSILSIWSPVLLTLIWVFIPLFLVMVVKGWVVCLVRPYRTVVLGFGLSAFVMMIVWGLNSFILLSVIIYWLIGCYYAYFAVRSLDNSIRFSLRPVVRGQSLLAFAGILMMGISFAIAYYESMIQSGATIPPAIKQALTEASMQSFENRLDVQAENDKIIALQEGRQELDMLWSSLERTMEPYSSLVPFAAGTAVTVVLYVVFVCLAWIPAILLEVLFPVLSKLKLICISSEMKQVQRFILD